MITDACGQVEIDVPGKLTNGTFEPVIGRNLSASDHRCAGSGGSLANAKA